MVFSRRRAVTPFEERLGYRFRRQELLETALTHRSHANEKGHDRHYERLEFLGDAVLGVVAAEWLYATFPDLPEGDLSKLKSQLVSTRTLADRARLLGLGGELRLGVGEDRSGGRKKASLLADSLEAVLGAVWLDGGPEAARALVRDLLEATMEGRKLATADTKTRLQELVQARGWELPEYRVVQEDGPDHRKRFTVECLVEDEVRGRGDGRSKKAAEQAAAAAVLERLSEDPASA